MAALKSLECREHGGTFKVPPKRGRPPTRCGGSYPECDMAGNRKAVGTLGPKAKQRAEQTLSLPAEGTPVEAAETVPKSRRKASPVVVHHNPSIPLASHAREQLEPLGWQLTGKAWFDEEDDAGWASVEGHRGVEHIGLWFRDGKLHSSDYTLWDAAKESTNGRPKSRLPFDPEELTDAELAVELRNRKITFWNRTGKSRETAVIRDKFQIKHGFDFSEEGEYYRNVEFIDRETGGYRAVAIASLLKVE